MEKFDKSMFGRRVKFTNAMAHEDEPWFYPEVDTVGIIVSTIGTSFEDFYDIPYVVQWPDGSTSDKDLWSVSEESLELVDEEIKIEVAWTGKYPNLCHGEWILRINGEDKSNLIPKKLRTTHMDTYGTYMEWHYNDWDEDWVSYKNGLKCDEWIIKNKYWLNNISADEEVQKQLYEVFRANDWRYGSCGGCIK